MAGAERVAGSVALVLDLDIELATFQQQRSTYLLKMAAFLGVSMSRLSLEPEATEGGADAESGTTTRFTLTILPAPEGAEGAEGAEDAGGAEPTAEEAAALMVGADTEELSLSLGVQVNSAAMKEESSEEKKEDPFPVVAVVVSVGVVVALGGLVAAVVYLRLRRSKQGSGKPILKEMKSDKGPKMVALQDEKAEQVTASI